MALRNNWVWFGLVGVAVIVAALTGWQVAHHVMWRDELQAYVVARDSHSLALLWENMGFEGFPALWFGVLKVLQLFTDEPSAMQWLHYTIALVNIGLIVRYAPFPSYLKIILILSFPFSIQYAVFSRCYAIGIVFLLAALVAHDKGRPFFYWLFLGIAAQSTILVMCLVGMLGLHRLLTDPKAIWKERKGVVLCVLLILLAIISAWPHPNRMGVYDIAAAGHPLLSFFQSLGKAFASPLIIGSYEAGFLFVAILLALLGGLFWRMPASLAAYGAGLGAFLTVDRLGYPLSPYHLMLLLVGAGLLAWQSRVNYRWPQVVSFVLLFLASSLAGVQALTTFNAPVYSQSKATAGWIVESKLEKAAWVAVPDYTATPVAGYAGMSFYYPQCDCIAAAPHWSKLNHKVPPLSAVFVQAKDYMTKQGLTEVWVLLGNAWGQGEYAALSAPEGAFIEPVKVFAGAMVADEQYLVYRMGLETR